MFSIINNYSPNTWDKTINNSEVCLPKNSNEYKIVDSEVRNALPLGTTRDICNIYRNQNLHDYGQFLLRGQLLVAHYPKRSFYEVRRFISISQQFRNPAVKYNMDPRRCGNSDKKPTLKKYLGELEGNSVILVVRVLSEDPNLSEITPTYSAEYFIEYIVEF